MFELQYTSNTDEQLYEETNKGYFSSEWNMPWKPLKGPSHCAVMIFIENIFLL